MPGLEQRLAPNTHGWPQDELDSSYVHRSVLRQVADIIGRGALYHGHYHWRYDDDLLLDDGRTVRVTGLDCEVPPVTRTVLPAIRSVSALAVP